MFKNIIISALLLGLWQTNAMELNFKKVGDLVRSQNNLVLSKRNLNAADNEQTGSLKRSFLPSISVVAGQEDFKKGTTLEGQQPYWGVEGRLNIYNGGRDRLQNDIDEIRAEKSKNELKVTIAKELAEARTIFWHLVYLERDLELLKKVLLINERNLTLANKRIRSGVATPSDRLEFEMKRIDLQRDIKFAEAEMMAKSLELKVALGLDVHKAITINEPLEHNDEWESDLKHSHDSHTFFTKPSALLAEELLLEQKKTQRSWVPKLDVVAGSYQMTQRQENFTDEKERQETVVGLQLSMKFFDGFNTYKRSQSLKAKARAADNIRVHTAKVNEAHIEKEFIELKTLHDQVHESEKHIKLAQKYYNMTKAEYKRGAKGSPDVLGAAERLEQVERKKNELLRDFHIARSHVLSKIGK